MKNIDRRPILGTEYRSKTQEPAEVRAISETHVVLFFPERLIEPHQVVRRDDFNGHFALHNGATDQ